MYTLHKESVELMASDVASGTLQRSKILNCVVWKSKDIDDPVPLVCQNDSNPFPDDNKRSDESATRVTYSTLNKLDKHTVWNCLSTASAEEDGCEYCTMLPAKKQLYPKHQIYTNGKLTCPVMLKTLHNCNDNYTNSGTDDNKNDK